MKGYAVQWDAYFDQHFIFAVDWMPWTAERKHILWSLRELKKSGDSWMGSYLDPDFCAIKLPAEPWDAYLDKNAVVKHYLVKILREKFQISEALYFYYPGGENLHYAENEIPSYENNKLSDESILEKLGEIHELFNPR